MNNPGSEPRVSVVMPLYNRAALVGRAVASVLAQTMAQFELIVVDDGSSDGGPIMVEAAGDPRVRLIRLPENRGANAARNRGIREARAPLVAFLDSDDEYLPAKLERVVARFDAEPGLEVLVDSFRRLYGPGEKAGDEARVNPVLTGEAFLEALFTRRLHKATGAISVRREAAVRVGGFDEGLRRLQDFDFIVRLAREARCASSDEVLWIKHPGPGAISGSVRLIPALVEVVRRDPDYRTDPRFRARLAFDLRRHLDRQLKPRRLGGAIADLRAMAGLWGWSETLRLLREGRLLGEGQAASSSEGRFSGG